jgi:hypothetical protein
MPVAEQLAETESVAKAEPELSPVSPTSAPARDVPVAPELSPRASPEETAAAVSAQGQRNGGGAVKTLANVQSAFGNGYASEVITRLREKRTGEQALTAEAAPAKAAAPATAPAPAPAPEKPAAEKIEPAPEPKAEPPKAPPPPEAASPAASAVVPAAEAAPQTVIAAPAPLPPKPESASPIESEAKDEKAAAAPAAAMAAPSGGGGAAAAAAPAAAGPAEKAEAPTTKETAPAADTAAGKPDEGKAEAAPSEPAPEQKSPASPEEDPAFQAVIANVNAVAQKQGHNSPAQKKAAEAQAAAPAPANDITSQAAGAQVSKMADQKPKPFDKAGFKAALMEKIKAITPKNLEEADEFKKKDTAGSIKGDVVSQVDSGKQQAQGDIKATAQQAPDPGAATPKEVKPLPPTEAGPAPPDVGAAAAAPKPKSEEEVSLQAGSQSLDNAAASSSPPVDQDLVGKSNEPQFQTALDKKNEAQKDAQERPAEFRKEESGIVQDAQQKAVGAAAAKTGAMHGARQGEFAKIGDQQGSTQAQDQQKRAEVNAHIEGIYNETKQKVEMRLARLDEEVNKTFDSGAEQAKQQFESYVDDRMRKYKDARYGGPGGPYLWIKDKLLGLPDEVNVFYTEARDLYVSLMDKVIDDVAGIVETGLTEAVAIIDQGRQAVQTYIQGLPAELQGIGQEAAEKIQEKFDNLASSVEEKKGQLVDSLAQKYVDNVKAIDDRVKEMKAANGGLVDDALAAVKGVVDTIIQLKNMLLGVLAKAAGVIDTIIKDPIGFLGNLIGAVKLGLDKFVSNIGKHLQAGLMGWLFGALAEAGIQMPESFDLKGILSLVLQVLGLTYANFRARAVAIVGEPIVKALETAAEVFKILITEGPGGLWNFIKDQIGNLKDMVIDGIKGFIIEKVIIAGVTWLIGLLNPASAFVKACKAIYDVVMFFVTRGAQIMAMVNSILDSMAAIASGAIEGAAAAVENSLAKAVPVVISFLASLLGLGGISEKIREIIGKIRAPINKAIDWVINLAVKVVKAAGKLVTGLFGKKKDKDEEPAKEDDPAKAAKVEAGLAALDAAESAHMDEKGTVSKEDAEGIAKTVKSQHPVFSSVTVIDGGKTWDFEYTASPGKKKKGAKKKGGQFSQTDLEKKRPIFYKNTDAGLGRGGPATARVDKKDGDREDLPAVKALPGGEKAYLDGDHRGHLIGDRFGGSATDLNLVPMHRKLNLSTFKKYENEVAKEITTTQDERGAALAEMDVSPIYAGSNPKAGSTYRPIAVTASAKLVTFKVGSTPPEIEEKKLTKGGTFTNPKP